MNILSNNKIIIIIIIIISLFIILLSILLIYYSKNKLNAGDIVFDEHCKKFNEYEKYINEYKNYIETINVELSSGWYYVNFQKFKDTYKFKDNSANGWKIHISPTFENALKVLKIVYKYHGTSELDFIFKCMGNLGTYYEYVSKSNLDNPKCDSIRGKFIAIYTRTDKEAVQIANDLNRKFINNGLVPNNFITIKNDFQIYPGIYARLCNYVDNFGPTRDKIGILYKELYAYLTLTKNIFGNDIPNLDYINYIHPFNKLKFNGRVVPKNVCIINDLLVSRCIIDDTRKCINEINNPYYIYAIKIMEHYKKCPDITEIIMDDKNIPENVKDSLDNKIFGNSLKTYYKYKKLLELHQKSPIIVTNDDLKNYIINNNIIGDEQSFVNLLITSTEISPTNIDVSIYERLQNIFKHKPEYYVFNMDEFIGKNSFSDIINIDVDRLVEKLNKLINLYNYLNQRVRDVCRIMWNNIQSIDFKFGFDYELLYAANDKAYEEIIRILFDDNIKFKDVIKYNDIPRRKNIYNEISQKFSYLAPIEYQKEYQREFKHIYNFYYDDIIY